MKYLFTLPEQPAERLFVAHTLHLDREQRRKLCGGEPVETAGLSVPVTVSGEDTDEPAVEVPAHYVLRPGRGRLDVAQSASGWEVSLPDVQAAALADVKDGGCGFLTFATASSEAVHQVVIRSAEAGQ